MQIKPVLLLLVLSVITVVWSKSPPVWPKQFDAAFDVLVPKYVRSLHDIFLLRTVLILHRDPDSFKKVTCSTTGRYARCAQITTTGAYHSSARNVHPWVYITRPAPS